LSQQKRLIRRNRGHWDGKIVFAGDEFDVTGKGPGGASPKKPRDSHSPENAKRIVRRQRLAQLAKEERRKAKEVMAADEARNLKATIVVFEVEEFVTSSFIDRPWDKETQRAFFKWTRSFSGLEHDEQKDR
jgi:hypothetical protein